MGATLPARRVHLANAIPPNVLFGAYHVHSNRSDGTGTPDEIADAAARAGLQFVILTDHGNATRPPDPPAYRHGVLVIDAVEISTSGGHVVALHLPSAAPYPLGGEPRDVVEDIHRLGGWAFVAHPDSPKPELRWTAWDVPYDGLEWINADSEWRDETSAHLAMTVVRSLVRGPEAVTSLFARPVGTIARWDRVIRRTPVVAIAALDAHALAPWSDDSTRRGRWLAVPSYATMFGTLAQAVVLGQPPSGDAAADAGRILDALGGGRTFTLVRAIAGPATLEFDASQSGATARMGDRLDDVSAVTTFRAEVPGVPGARVALFQNGREVRAGLGRVTYSGIPAAGAYRVEATMPGSDLPWIFSNPIYIGPIAAVPARPAPAAIVDRITPLPVTGAWTVEHHTTSSGVLTLDRDEIRFAYALDTGALANQFAAVVSPITGEAGIRQIEFTGRADRPMRISVQVRLAGGRDGRRWQRSVYLDQAPRSVVIQIADLEPTGAATTLRPNVATIQSLMFVVDIANTPPGARGTIWLSKIALGGGPPD